MTEAFLTEFTEEELKGFWGKCILDFPLPPGVNPEDHRVIALIERCRDYHRPVPPDDQT